MFSSRQKAMVLVILIAMFVNFTPYARAADNGNGTYTNPIMWGDYPDNDVIRVGDTYYMSSTSMHLFPGSPIMSSKDLVNWTYESYAVNRMEGDMYDLKNGLTAYDEGPWATSLRYHNGKFYLMYNINRDAAYVSIANNAKGPWTIYKLEDELYDPGLFFDDNGKVYVVHGQGRLYLSELKTVNEETGELSIISKREPGASRNGKMIYDYKGGYYNEGSHVYKIGEYYYILSTPTWAKGSKKEIAIRTKDLANGPYEVKDIMTSFMNFTGNGIHQGGIVDVPQGEGKESEWWSVIFQDRGKLGRVPTLQPVYWKDEWPYIGELDGEKAVVTLKKPNIPGLGTTEPRAPETSDDFSSSELGLQWQWNHNPDNEKWSLTERPGYIRLRTSSVINSLAYARNTLTQRIIGPDSIGTVQMDISHMADGDQAGLSVIQKDSNFIGIKNEDGQKRIVVQDLWTEEASIDLPEGTTNIWFRAETPRFEYRTEFSYSLDGVNFTRLGGRYEMRYGTYVGMRFGIFNYATKALGGYIDVDSFELTTTENQGNLFRVDKKIDAERYDDQNYVTDKNLTINAKTEWTNDDVNSGYDQSMANIKNGDWLRYDQVDFGNGEAKWFNARIASNKPSGTIEVKLADAEGNPAETIAILQIPNTSELNAYVNAKAELTKEVTGKQKIFLVFNGADTEICKLNWFMFGSGDYPEIATAPAHVQVDSPNSPTIDIAWDAVSGALQYDIKIDNNIISNATSPFSETGLLAGSTHTVQVRSKNFAGSSEWSEGVNISIVADPEMIPLSGMTVTASSEETEDEDNKAGNVIDGDIDTIWHTKWNGGNTPPHTLDFNLGQIYDVYKLKYIPRQSGGDNGIVTKYNIYTSMDGVNYTLVKETGIFVSDSTPNTVTFKPTPAHYLRFEVLAGKNGFGSAAEMNIYQNADSIPVVSDHKIAAANSEQAGFEASKANDGDIATAWKAVYEDPMRTWTVDLEDKYDLTEIELEWAAENASKYKVEVSSDHKVWTSAVDRTADTETSKVKTDRVSNKEVRYVKVTFTEGIASIDEIRVRGMKSVIIPESNDVVLNKPATSDSQQNNNPASAGNDGDESTRWCVADDKNPHYWQVNLGEKYDLTGSKVIFEKAGKAMMYKIEVSSDAATWTTVIDHMNNSTNTEQVRTDNWTAKGAQYIKVTVMGYPDLWGGFREFKAYGAKSPVVDTTALEAAIAAAQVKVDQAVVGDQPGQYPQAAVDAFKAAIVAAQGIVETTTTQEEVKAAIEALQAAVKAFDDAKVPEEEPPADATAPTWTIDKVLKTSNVGRTSLTLSWKAAVDDTAVTSYKVYKNGSELVTLAGDITSYTVSGLSSDTTYTFKIEAGDAAENWGVDGPSVTVTTEASSPGGGWTPSPDPKPTPTPKPGDGNKPTSPEPPKVKLTDFAEHWAKASIEKSVELGFVTGYEDGTFRPNGTVTRGEFSTMLARALKLELGDAEFSFDDQKQTPVWAQPFIQAIAKAGYITGYEDGTFRANHEITRSELVVITVRALGLEVNLKAILAFDDADQIPVWAKPYVATAAEAGLIKGNGDGKFNPNASSTRAEAVTLILAMLNAK
ncbi:discoidin domain-containing protein [Bacillus sp. FJAT-28004]|uniref:discoidin domain-containing protein n=1 Tax=Bacillus sp. FJAT-28004 TaxID=1679165 RepID=UPI0006B4EC11|nr:discoidin domain-containing protein [Bacillus sp. FJAT-28004]